MKKTHYEVLGVPQNATKADIRKAYGEIAKHTHPDKSPDKEDEFREISQSYEILNSPLKRKEYDRILKNSPTFNSRAKIEVRGADLRVTLNVKMGELINQVNKTIVTRRKDICGRCDGTGSEKKETTLCNSCGGSGRDSISIVLGGIEKCRACFGLGKISVPPKCTQCNGSGLIMATLKRTVRLNAYSKGSMVIQRSGNYGALGTEPGNLIINFNIENDPVYQISGNDIKRTLDISPAQAIIGDTINLEIFGKKEKLIIPPGTQNGHLIEKDNAGLYEKGSLQVRVHIKIPEIITEIEKRHYESLVAIEKEGGCQKISKICC